MMMSQSSAAPVRREIYVIDDNSEMRRSLHKLFGTIGITASPFPSAGDFLDGICGLRPAPILLDVHMPEIDGLELLAELRRRERKWPVIMMTGEGEIPMAVRAMRLGAIEFLSKPFEVEQLESALELAYDALEETTAAEQKRDAARGLLSLLTGRERLVALRLATGMSNKEVARALDLSVRTVEMHRGNAMRKMGVNHVVELATLINAAGPDAHATYSE